ncbi:hypothetical protein TI04_06870 [Achromatium sp. WMS2]|nr:hypothetical protein TI04_06870 [Achromatium sp. WMS2]
MKKLLTKLCLILVLIAPLNIANAALMRNVVQSCAFGAGIMATVTYMGLAPEINTGVLAIPASEIILTNAAAGCVIGAVGATAATVVGWFYDAIF